MKTTDGGLNWNKETSGTDRNLNDIYFMDSNFGWAVGSYGTILHTTNGGLDWKKHVITHKNYVRPAEVDKLRGDASKAKKILKWKPKTKFKELVKMMVDADVEKEKKCM